MPFAATWMQLEIIKLSEVSKNERDKYDITCIWSLKTDTESWTQGVDWWLLRDREMREESIRSLGLADANWYIQNGINNKVVLYSTGNYIQYPVIKAKWERI